MSGVLYSDGSAGFASCKLLILSWDSVVVIGLHILPTLSQLMASIIIQAKKKKKRSHMPSSSLGHLLTIDLALSLKPILAHLPHLELQLRAQRYSFLRVHRSPGLWCSSPFITI